ncbi:MAG: lytic transglycosylase domain-containing protein, partial [Deltaproteobacteria bacterium]
FLGLGPPLDESGPAFDVEELELPGNTPENREEKKRGSGIDSLLRLLVSTAHAEESASVSLTDVKEWIPPARDFGPYLDRVKEVLEQAAMEAFSKSQLEASYQALHRNLILATAWQESCWRQFVRSQGKARYLVSYNQTSVGLMQINERVWRGLYRLESLRWNIRYNVRAGCEILNLYLKDYAMKKTESKIPLGPDTLVRVTYAMYNAGPREYHAFLKRNEKNVLYARDRLFWQKYSLSKEGQFDGLSVCLGGE